MQKTMIKVIFTALVIFNMVYSKVSQADQNWDTIWPDRESRLAQGEILTYGEYIKGGVEGQMQAVVEASPERVWQLYIRSNDWNSYHIPFLADQRAIGEDQLPDLIKCKEVDEAYKILGDRVFDPLSRRKKGMVWESLDFQYVNVKWPLKNRWVILKNTNDETQANQKKYRADWEKVGGDLKMNRGYITLEPYQGDPKRTFMHYNIKTGIGGIVPKFLLRIAVKKSMPDAIKAIRRASATNVTP